jgi:hypothetical protein
LRGHATSAPPRRRSARRAPDADPEAGGATSTTNAAFYARNGYAVLVPSGLLVDEGVARPDALAATGISLGGGQTLELAMLRNRIGDPLADAGRHADAGADRRLSRPDRERP